MATKLNTTSAFIAKLLAPIPANEEQVDTLAFRKLCVRDGIQRWSTAMEAVKLAEARHSVAALGCRRGGNGNMMENHTAYMAAHTARREQLFVPAPTDKKLRWKRRVIKGDSKLERDADVVAAIARDEVRLAA